MKNSEKFWLGIFIIFLIVSNYWLINLDKINCDLIECLFATALGFIDLIVGFILLGNLISEFNKFLDKE